jgi:hypothetical protein
VPGWVGDGVRLGDDVRLGDVSGWRADAARLGDADGDGAGLDESPGGLLSDGRPELGGLPGPGGPPECVTPGESHGPVSAPGAAVAAGPDGDPAGAARPGRPAG